ncbi:MAG: hypothetical protein J7K84_09595 [Deltaproteobacteria bacterium]|nr:hypothetical protein [Deltaproteobacteria bacterium]
MKIFSNLAGTIGSTPLVQLNKEEKGFRNNILLKLEYFNPLGYDTPQKLGSCLRCNR